MSTSPTARESSHVSENVGGMVRICRASLIRANLTLPNKPENGTATTESPPKKADRPVKQSPANEDRAATFQIQGSREIVEAAPPATHESPAGKESALVVS